MEPRHASSDGNVHATDGRAGELPLIGDLVKLEEFLKEQIRKEDDLFRLSKLCLAQLILLNKRQPQEVAELTIEDFKAVQEVGKIEKEVLDHLDITERILAMR